MSARITRLSVENIKKVSAVQIDPSGNLIVIGGKNGAGKTSVLDSIEIALRGAAAIPSKPVRRGEDKAKIEMQIGEVIDLGDITVKRTITATGGGALVITNKDGVKLKTPQEILDRLTSKLSFDPLAFVAQSSKERGETLRALVGLDFTALDKEREEVFGLRTQANRHIKSKEALIAANPRHPGTPAAEIDIAALVRELEVNRKANTQNDKLRQETTRARLRIDQIKTILATENRRASEIQEVIARYQKQLAEIQKAVELNTEDLNVSQERLAKIEEVEAALVDAPTTEIQNRIVEAEAVNRTVRANQEVDKFAAELKESRKIADGYTTRLEQIDKIKRDSIQDAKFPVEGLSLSDTNEVLFNNLPFDQANTAQQIRVSVAMGIALNPNFPVLLIRRGSDLDPENLKLMSELATAAGAQVWLESSRTDGPISVPH